MKKNLNLMKSALMFLCAGAVVFTSCSKDDTTEGNDPVAVRFSSAINQPDQMTKASGAAWAANDKVGIFMVNAGATTIAEGADNRQYTTTGTNSFAAVGSDQIFYPLAGAVDFIAYYPYVAGQTLEAPYVVNVADQTSQADIDLLWSNNATGKTKANANVAMNFDHKLTKVIINTTAGDGLTTGDLGTMSVTIKGMYTKADFNLATGILGAGNTPADITPRAITLGSQYEAIVLPATFATNTLTMEFALNNAPKNEVFKRINTASEVFEAGKVYTYNAVIQRTGVTFTCTITDWVAAPDRNIVAE